MCQDIKQQLLCVERTATLWEVFSILPKVMLPPIKDVA